jgi:hypothetical protein
VDLIVTISGPDAGDETRSLHAWLADDEELRGRARLAGAAVQPGTLGPAAETLAVALGPGGVTAALATALVAWLRHRTSDVVITARGNDGRELQLSAKRVHGMSPERLSEFTTRLADDLGVLADQEGPGRPAGR